ncbi:amino acid transporter [Rhodococcus sp. 27YEA15]|uniref:APC family permease n=1 Tax=Rhodococcus sp. 27YEA15 TaxID=3156259 RepID=UPI003C7DCD20
MHSVPQRRCATVIRDLESDRNGLHVNKADKSIGTRSPVSGLRRRTLGFAQVLAQSVSAVAPSAVMVTLPVLVIPNAGRLTIAVFAAAATLMAVVGYCAATFATRMVAVSGLYSYTAKGLGPIPGFLAGWSLIIGLGTAAMASVLGGAIYVGALLGQAGIASGSVLVAALALLVGALAMITLVRGLSLSAKIALAVEAFSIVAAAAVLMILHLRNSPTAESIAEPDVTGGSIGFALLLSITAFVGFESAGTVASEARHPYSSVPRAIVWTPWALGVLYIFAAAMQFNSNNIRVGSDTPDAIPLTDLTRQNGSGALSFVLDIGIAGSWFACILGSTTALARVLFAMGREGVLPSMFGKAHRRHGTPYAALCVSMPVIVITPAVLIAVTDSARTVFLDLLTVSAHGYVLAYILVCVATPVFLRRIGELTAGPLIAGILGAGSLLAVIVWNASAQTITTDYLTALYLSLMLAGVLVLAARRLRTPQVLQHIGLYDEPVAADLLAPDLSISRPGEAR